MCKTYWYECIVTEKKKAVPSNPGADIYVGDMLKDNMYSNSPHTADSVIEVIHNYVLCYDNTIFIKACVFALVV